MPCKMPTINIQNYFSESLSGNSFYFLQVEIYKVLYTYLRYTLSVLYPLSSTQQTFGTHTGKREGEISWAKSTEC